MIKLVRPPAPSQLTPALALKFSAVYAADRTKRVWNRKYIRDTLMAMSHNKCAYCETAVDEESKYMEVDHYRCKDKHPGEVVTWTNLLPACKRCNVNKSSHDVIVDGDLIDPSIDSPPDHLFLFNYRLYGRDEKGSRAIDLLYLNETSRIVRARFAIGEAVSGALEALAALLRDQKAIPTVSRARQISRGMVAVFREAAPPSEFSATAATSLLRDPNYRILKVGISQLGLWTPEMTQYEAIVETSALV